MQYLQPFNLTAESQHGGITQSRHKLMQQNRPIELVYLYSTARYSLQTIIVKKLTLFLFETVSNHCIWPNLNQNQQYQIKSKEFDMIKYRLMRTCKRN